MCGAPVRLAFGGYREHQFQISSAVNACFGPVENLKGENFEFLLRKRSPRPPALSWHPKQLGSGHTHKTLGPEFLWSSFLECTEYMAGEPMQTANDAPTTYPKHDYCEIDFDAVV